MAAIVKMNFRNTAVWKYVIGVACGMGIFQFLLFYSLHEWTITEIAGFRVGLPYDMNQWSHSSVLCCLGGMAAVALGTGKMLYQQLEEYRYTVMIRYHSYKRYGKHVISIIIKSTMMMCAILFLAGVESGILAYVSGIQLDFLMDEFLYSCILFITWQITVQMVCGWILLYCRNIAVCYLVQFGLLVISLLHVGGQYFPGNYGMYLRVKEYHVNCYPVVIFLIECAVSGYMCTKICGGNYGKNN